ncbi:CDP-alcohol phosphatidyltransferase family protein [Plastoroseomonas hellenica]|uniref:Phosphatidylcholine/phosphatidylserine synthase n=1 Tax=Plastoroseomonas hellenica TaxID=2687306 RepID=A0ABS5FA16_9PROT|nr:CDP-alcohol phosphatidyltransferase family protein [Plastoroseomonas hellenica]MBR0647877.1 phosphatidylcholine/phosphatidylserine synthase [Plastoroseomonas hellenica]MBR0669402.1 phosphatidylcholine/phosphatidylserine synthase [Plastoroseomonas hellenica]
MSGEGPRPHPMRRLRRRFRPRTRPRFEGLSFNRLIPNLMTMLGLCAGLVAIRAATEGRFGMAAALIVVAAVIDGLDGRLARLLKATSRFGAEFDSLSDFLCFGVAPAFVLYLWTMHDARGIGFAPCLMFAVCMALRLARFNAALDVGVAPKPAYAYNFFTGVPAPAGAAVALVPLFAGLALGEWGQGAWVGLVRNPITVGLVLIVTAMLLVSTLPTWSFKNFKVPRAAVLPLLLGVGLFVALLLSEPWAALAAAGLIYLGMLPFSVRSYLRLKHEAESMLEPVVVADNGPRQTGA